MASEADKKRIKEIGELIGEAILLTVSRDRPESGQDELTEEQKAKLKATVGEAFTHFLEHREWKAKTDPLIDAFKAAYMPIALRYKLQEKENVAEVIRETFPSLDPELECHAVLNLIAHMATVGPFRKVKDETLAKIVEDQYTSAGLIIAYLQWRVKTTTPAKEDQH